MKTMLTALLLSFLLCACNPGTEEPTPRPPIGIPDGQPDGEPEPPGESTDPDTPSQTTRTMKITIGSAVFPATLADNTTAAAFGTRLPMIAAMGELNGNEKYFYLSGNLPAEASAPGTIRSGELMLFGTNCVVLFYKTFPTSYSYTRIGSIDNPSGLEEALGRGDTTVKFELTNE